MMGGGEEMTGSCGGTRDSQSSDDAAPLPIWFGLDLRLLSSALLPHAWIFWSVQAFVIIQTPSISFLNDRLLFPTSFHPAESFIQTPQS